MPDAKDWSMFEDLNKDLKPTPKEKDWSMFEDLGKQQTVSTTSEMPKKEEFKYLQDAYDNASKVTPERVVSEITDIPSAAGLAFSRIAKGASTPISSAAKYAGYEDEAKYVNDMINDSLKFWGQKVAANKAERINKYGKESWGVGEAIGLAAPEAIVSFATKSTIGTAVSELGLSTLRNDFFASDKNNFMSKLGVISTDASTALIGAYAINKFLPANQIQELRKMINTMEDEADKKVVQGAVQAIDRAGIDFLDYEARDKILKKIVGGEIANDVELGNIIKAEVKKAHTETTASRNQAYEIAKEEADKTRFATSKELKNDFSSWLGQTTNDIPNTSFFEDEAQRKILNMFKGKISGIEDTNARGLEILRKEYSSKMDSANDSTKVAYGSIVKFIEDKQSKLLNEAGLGDVFAPARAEYAREKALFKGDVAGHELSYAGKSISKVEELPKEYQVVEQMFGKNIDANIAKAYVSEIKGDMKTRIAAVEYLLKKDIADDIGSQAGSLSLMKNYDKMDKDAIKIMLGDKGAKELQQNMDALGMVHAALEVAKGKDKNIGKDVLELGAALAASHISPYASVHVAINSTKNILDKTMAAREQRITILKEIAKSEKTPAIRQMFRALNMMKIEQPVGLKD